MRHYEKEKRGADDTDEAQRKTTHKKRKPNIRSGVKYLTLEFGSLQHQLHRRRLKKEQRSFQGKHRSIEKGGAPGKYCSEGKIKNTA